MMRAAHQILDNPKIFEDPIALSIIGAQGASDIGKNTKFAFFFFFDLTGS